MSFGSAAAARGVRRSPSGVVRPAPTIVTQPVQDLAGSVKLPRNVPLRMRLSPATALLSAACRFCGAETRFVALDFGTVRAGTARGRSARAGSAEATAPGTDADSSRAWA